MNVITIEADQLSAKWVGCYGCAAAHTPNIDALARRGVRFANAFTNHPVCMPARASTITGRSAQHHGVFYNGWELGTDIATFPQLLQKAGVQTFGVGKYHLECHSRGAYNDVRKYGFDRAETTEDIRAGDWLDWVEREHPDCAEAALATVWPMEHLSSYGPSGRNLRQEALAARAKLGVGGGATHPYLSPVPEKACQTRWVGDRAIVMLAERDSSRPFFLKMSFVDPHDPYDPPARFVDRIDESQIPAPIRTEDPGVQGLIERLRTNRFVGNHSHLTNAQWTALRKHYLASLAFLDEQVGRLVDYLERARLAEDTAILLFSDHGDMMGDHGLPTKGSWHFDACCRVPMILALPGGEEQGRVVEQTVTNLDVFPTVLELAGVHCSVPIEGDSLLPLAHGETLDRPDAALIETYGSYGDEYGPFRARSVVTPDARLTRFEDGHGLLFDLADDPDETVDLYDHPQAHALQCSLERTMLDLITRQYHNLPLRHKHPIGGH
jgi:arylsulfatase A-like enzyme